jgi:tRNA threonylcarbamoyladenosine biosynthesis protein TsaB
MATLALDTSSAISVAVVDGDEILASDSVFAPRGHAELLAPMIRDALARAGAGLPGDVDGAGITSIVVGTGPAPFTGLRVGLVTAKTLALAWGVPVWGVCSLDALGSAHGGAVTVVADARRREVYWARYQGGERVEGPSVSAPADVPALALAGAIVGRGAALYPDVFGEAPPESAWHPDPAWLARIAARRLGRERLAAGRFGRGAGDLGVDPLYLRRPDVHGTPPS